MACGALIVQIPDGLLPGYVERRESACLFHQRNQTGCRNNQPVMRFFDREVDHAIAKKILTLGSATGFWGDINPGAKAMLTSAASGNQVGLVLTAFHPLLIGIGGPMNHAVFHFGGSVRSNWRGPRESTK